MNKITKPKKESVSFVFRISPKELEIIKLRAKKFADSNISLWLRHAAMHYTPSKVKPD